MLEPKEKAEELVKYFLELKNIKLSDFSKIEHPTARKCAIKVCDEVLGFVGTDLGYLYWSDIKRIIEEEM